MYVTIPEGQYQRIKTKEQNRAYIGDVKENGDYVKLTLYFIKRTGLDRLQLK